VAILLACRTSRIGRRCQANVDGSVSVTFRDYQRPMAVAARTVCRLGMPV
jgi:hypothetical protein